eukprot:914774-Pelagomonas_calceolata.AAC.3
MPGLSSGCDSPGTGQPYCKWKQHHCRIDCPACCLCRAVAGPCHSGCALSSLPLPMRLWGYSLLSVPPRTAASTEAPGVQSSGDNTWFEWFNALTQAPSPKLPADSQPDLEV